MAILYKANETDFTHLGLGPLNDAISILVTEERNGIFELEMQYPVSGQLFGKLKNDRLIKADAGHNLKNQRFKIIRITKPLDGIVTVNAEHISYLTQDLALKPKVSYNGNARQALEHWKENIIDDNPFVMWSNITTTGRVSWTIDEVENPRRALGGVEGSMLDVYGGEYLFDNYEIRLLEKRGVNSDALIAYGRNLIDLTQEEEIANTYTSVYPFSIYRDDDGNERLVTLPEYYIDSQYVNNFARRKILAVDFTQDEIETVSALRNAANRYITDNDIGVPRVNLKVKYLDLTQTLDYKNQSALEEVNLCDNVMIYFEKFDINTTAKVIKVVWDDLRGHYDSIEIGETRASLSQAIDSVVDGRVEKAEKLSIRAMRTADGKNTIYWGLDEPTGDLKKGDLWFEGIDGEYEATYRYNGINWQRIIDKNVKDIEETANTARNRASEAVEKAELATGNATEAITQAQTAFDKAQESLTTAQGFSSRISDTEDNISTLNQTTQSFATRIENAEGSISTLSQTAQGLQNRVADAEDNITSVTQIATGLQTRMTNAEGSINTLTQTASSLDSTIKSVRADLDGLEIGTTNLVENSKLRTLSPKNTGASSDNYNYERYYSTDGLIAGETYTFRARIEITHGDFDRVTLYSYPGGSNQSFPINENGYVMRSFTANESTDSILVYAGQSGGTRGQGVIIHEAMFVRGNKIGSWQPAPEDLATQSQITQLADNINLRVVQKDDVINQINISTEDILISGKKLILDGDTTVTGTFRVENANITSVDAGKMTTGILNAAQVSIINLSANSIIGGIQQSQNSNTTFNWNTGELNLVNNNITFGTGANINFESNSNTLTYRKYDSQDSITRSAGVGVGDRIGGRYPFAYLGTTGASNLDSLSPYFSGFIANSTAAIGDDATNSVNGFVFQMRNRAVDWDKGITFDFNGSRPSISTISPSTYAYDIGTFGRLFGRQAFGIVNYTNERSGWLMETAYAGNNTDITFRGNYSSEYNYQIGGNSSSNAIRNIYLRNNPIVVSDRRAKEDITDNVLGLDFINSIDTRTFRLKQKPSEVEKNKLQFGFIAQELIDSLTTHDISVKDYSIIGMGEDGLYNLKETQLIAPAIKAIQEVDDKVNLTREELLMKIAELEARVNYLEAA